ncbi:MAG: bifunctional 5,10-methylenetetrahydrofolate dehydrogenase/5,10-methenyltetrahydrofolate cyclohydrolase [Firmicutes bacterium]|nr:bifunctional 5,10-methylenetetrahydrofolate dehydrogenase/5,10-methenyltetrahydrofolate cyclohydrolase [Bacillota bacterium]
MANLLKGKVAADALNETLLDRAVAICETGIAPTLAIVRVGENGSDIAYENGAVKKAQQVAVAVEKFICPENVEEDDLVEIIKYINDNEKIHGMLLLQPLPKHLNAERIRNTIAPEKDMDCISDGALAGLFLQKEGGYAPCTAESCMEILKYYDIPVAGKKVVVIGRSLVIGKPVALMLMKENATVTICHTKTTAEDMKLLCQQADIIIAAAGHRNTLTAEMVRPGQVIVDVGINFNEDGKMVGDVDFEPVSKVVDAITPVPGGVGSMTTTLLMKHVIEAAEKTTRE